MKEQFVETASCYQIQFLFVFGCVASHISLMLRLFLTSDLCLCLATALMIGSYLRFMYMFSHGLDDRFLSQIYVYV